MCEIGWSNALKFFGLQQGEVEETAEVEEPHNN